MEQQMNLGQQPPRINQDMIKNATLVECECGGKLFVEKMILKKISPILSPTGKEELFPMNILVCEKCGLMPKSIPDPDNLIPAEFKTK